MSTFNLRYNLESPDALVGMVADSRVTHTLTAKAAGTIAFGQPVTWAGAVLSTDVPMMGVARLDTSRPQTDAGVVNYVANDPVPVVSFGPVWVETAGAVAAGAFAYVVLATGLFTATPGGGTTSAPVGYFETATTGAGKAVLFVQRQTEVGGA